MKKLSITSLSFLLLCLLVWFGCKKEKKVRSSSSPNIFTASALTPLPIPSSEAEIQNHLQWIARGYPDIVQNVSGFRVDLNTYLDAKVEKTEIHDILQPDILALTSVDVDLEVHNNVNSRFATNTYDKKYFWGFTFNNCDFKVGLELVDTMNLSLPWAFTYESVFGLDTVQGYFINTSNQLDSVELSSNNYDLYNVIKVITISICDTIAAGPPPESMGCNNNNICEPQQGEFFPDCPDCPDPNLPPINNEKVLKIDIVRIDEDRGMFEEAWGNGKYEVAWQFCVADGTNGLISSNRDNQDNPYFYSKWKRKQVPRKRNNRRGMRGTATNKGPGSNGADIYHKFDPNQHDLYFHFFESDKYGPLCDFPIVEMNSGNPVTFPAGKEFAPTFWFINKGGTFDEGNVGSGQSDGIHVIPAGSAWIPGNIGGKAVMMHEFHTPGLNEVFVRIYYEQ